MNQIAVSIKNSQEEFHPVVPFDPSDDRLISLDLTEANSTLTETVFNDLRLFMDFINSRLEKAHARYGIGGYAEHRALYSRSRVFDADGGSTEPRRLHLGIDIWGKPHTAVMAPISGIVHSFAFNDHPGDYGATIILTHQLERTVFYTLYGHLSLNSIRNLREGLRIEKGDIFAEFGIPSENGHWPPHLHFQVIGDLEGLNGDYPGVCRFSEKDKYLSNCPDPDLLLQMNRYLEIGHTGK